MVARKEVVVGSKEITLWNSSKAVTHEVRTPIIIIMFDIVAIVIAIIIS